MSTMGTRSKSSAWSVSTRPTRARSPQSQTTMRSGSRSGSGDVRKRPMCGMKSYMAGTGSAQTALTRAPRASSAKATPRAEPRASASGSR